MAYGRGRVRGWWAREWIQVVCGPGEDYLTWAVAPGSKTALRGGNNSVVECDLAKVEVVGSNPISRSMMLRLQRLLR